MDITREKLEQWRHVEGLGNAEIAQITGRTLGSINMLFHKYKIRRRKAGTSEENIAKIREMAAGGSSAAQIAEALGVSKAVAYKYMPEEKVEDEFALPKVMRMAEKREPHLARVTVGGKSYIDVTDLYIPH